MAGNNEENEEVEGGLDLQSLPADALELIVTMLDRKEVTAVSGQCRSLREAALSNFRGSLRRLLDRSARDLSALRNKALLMREQCLAGRHYSGLALLITTARLVRMELRILAAASWRHLCAPSGPGLALPGSLLDKIESVLELVSCGELTRSAQPEATANLFLSCEKYLEFFSDVLEPRLTITSAGWAPLGCRIADTLAATHSRRIHKEGITRAGAGQSVRLFASYRLPGLVEAPPNLPQILNALPSTQVPQTATDRSASAAAAHRILLYLRRSVHMHNLVLVLKDQWAMDDTLERRGSVELLSGFIFDQHDQQGECRFPQTETKAEFSRHAPKTNKDKIAGGTWDGLSCELHMVAPSIHLLPPHLQHVACQVWPQSSNVTLNSQVSCPSIKITSSTPKPSTSSLISKAGRSATSCGGSRTPALSRKSTRLSHSLMAVNSGRLGDVDQLQKSLSFDNVDAVNQVLCRVSRPDGVTSPSCSSLGPKTAKEIKTVDLSVVGNSCVCFTFSDLEDIAEDITQIEISDKPKESVLVDGKETTQEEPLHKPQSSSQFFVEDSYHFRLQITARYPEPNKTKSGLREATIIVIDSEDGPSAWLVDDVPVE